jgi:dTDP-4-amino-4,6-dideoxygalactose transaminase
MEIASNHGLIVIEDAAQAQGATYKNRRVGSLGHAAATSFYPGKNLGAWGEAGAVTTNDRDLADKMKMYREHGQQKKYYHDVVGWNGRMDGLQGAVLSVKLKYLERSNESRRRVARRYNELLADIDGIQVPREAEYAKHIYHIYSVRVADRNAVMKRLGDLKIGCGIHYPVPVHLQKAYANLGYKLGDFPVSEACASTFLSLPMFPEITDEQIQTVVSRFRSSLTPGLHV